MKMKKLIAKALSVVCGCFVCFAAVNPPSGITAKADSSSVIDMYLIAGQSNAAGYSPILDNSAETFENVWYAGMTEKALTGKNHSDYVNSDTTESFDSYKKSVTAGLGNLTNRIGPEYGIAKTINGMYANGDKKAMIFKTAAGGTSLLDDTPELSERYGNWYPRSLWEQGYTPDISGYYEGNDPTGLLYQLFVENFRKVYHELVEKGYTPVVKGMAWMQGETNLSGEYNKNKAYGDTLKTFITDIRADLADITGDETLASMPFVIGKIAPTFISNNNPNVPAMHAQQERVAEEMGESVSTVSTDDLIIVGEDGKPMAGCPDKFHFCFSDAVTLGQRFGEKIVELNGQKLVTASALNGKVDYKMNNDGSVTFYLTPKEHYRLQLLTVNGNDVTAQAAEGAYNFNDPSSRVYAEAVFAEKNKFELTYDDLGAGAGYWRKAKFWYEGETLSVKIFVNEGYTLSKVTFNGEEMKYNEITGEYETLILSEGKISAVVTKNTEEKPDGNLKTDTETGCNGSVALTGGTAAFAVCVLAITTGKRKKK
ncbi:MAG: sialate O-acetylesterase [Candidatus Borkfalkiaceae bacterium]|nr:sialate O-acetylesterase [Clostridia bacterium]MDY6222748.1 sialate O-acetylesterase [Christensenellaceae bacterium]